MPGCRPSLRRRWHRRSVPSALTARTPSLVLSRVDPSPRGPWILEGVIFALRADKPRPRDLFRPARAPAARKWALDSAGVSAHSRGDKLPHHSRRSNRLGRELIFHWCGLRAVGRGVLDGDCVWVGEGGGAHCVRTPWRAWKVLTALQRPVDWLIAHVGDVRAEHKARADPVGDRRQVADRRLALTLVTARDQRNARSRGAQLACLRGQGGGTLDPRRGRGHDQQDVRVAAQRQALILAGQRAAVDDPGA